jgi:hypothetical protein
MPYEAENYFTLADFYRENSTGSLSVVLADSLYRIAIRLNPFDETSYAGLGYLMLDENKPDSAFSFFSRGLVASGGTAQGLVRPCLLLQNTVCSLTAPLLVSKKHFR